MDTVTNTWLGKILMDIQTHLLTGTGLHNTLHLVAAPFAPSATLDPTTLPAPTYIGYAPVDVDTFGAMHLLPNGNYVINSTVAVSFAPINDTASSTIYGWYLLDIAGDPISMGLVQPPKVLGSATDVLTIVPAIGVAPAQTSSTIVP